MKTLKHLDLFSGIGGFAHGLRMAGGFETVAFCEIDTYCQQVLKQNFGKHIPVIEDIHDLTAHTLRAAGIDHIDVITAGFPCQPFSAAGKRGGINDERFLWPELFRIVAEVRPAFVILENSPEVLNVGGGLIFGGILYDLGSCGYDVEWQVIPASAFGAWHRRDRLWIVAYANCERESQSQGTECEQRGWFINSRQESIADTQSLGRKRGGPDRFIFAPTWHRSTLLACHRTTVGWREWAVEPSVGRVVNGLPHRVDRIKALGNAIVPQIVAYIGELILEHRDS